MKIEKNFFHQKLFILGLIFLSLILLSIFIYWKQFDKVSDSKVNRPQPLIPVPQRDQLSVLSGMVYRHLIGYNLVCTQAEAPLQKYPDYFAQKYESQIKQIDSKWEKYQTSLEEVLIKFDAEIYPVISADIQNELISLERMVAKNILAQKNNISVNQIQWNEELEKRLDLKDACILLDDSAAFLLEKSSFDSEFKKLLKEL